VLIGARTTFGRGIGLRLPVGGGILVIGVAIKRGGVGGGTGARVCGCGLLLGTGGIGADCIEPEC
jgi:hypothetical protein